jgi:predicted ATPase
VKLSEEVKSDFKESELLCKLAEIAIQEYAHQIEALLKRNLESIFGVPLRELIRIGTQKTSISFSLSPEVSFEISVFPSNAISINFKMNKQRFCDSILGIQNKTLQIYLDRTTSKIRRAKRASSKYRPLFDLYFFVGRVFMNTLYEFLGSASVYIIPAGRAGLLEGYNTVQSALLSLSPIAPIKGVTMPPIPGPAAEFYRIMLRLRGRRGPLSKVAREFEDMIKGRIVVRPSKVKGKLETLSYSFESDGKKGAIDVIHAASGIKEIVVLYLIVKEIVEKGDFLIIEEPESHLHPSAQTRLMEIISILIKRGVKVMLTTHSDIVLRKLSQLTGVYHLSKGDDPIGLNPDDFAAYLLRDLKSGSIAEKLSLTQYGSFEKLPSFDEVITELYNKELSLQSSIQMKE